MDGSDLVENLNKSNELNKKAPQLTNPVKKHEQNRVLLEFYADLNIDEFPDLNWFFNQKKIDPEKYADKYIVR